MSGSGGKGSSSSTTQVDIPQFLRPFLEQSTNTASGALSGLNSLADGNLVAGFTPDQEQAFAQARDVAGGGGDFIPTAQQTLLDTAQGRDLSSFLPEELFNNITSLGGGIDQFVDPAALDTLRSTAGGDFLFGGDGFNAAVDAAVNAATPQILSTFGRAGAGGSTSGLAQSAIGQSAVDAFAREFSNERRNQLGAANSLASIGGQDRGRALASAGLLSNFASGERNRQELAARSLPQAGLFGSNILSGIGDQIQGQNQFGLDAPQQAQLRLLQAALGGLPIGQLLGQSTDAENSFFGLGFGEPQ